MNDQEYLASAGIKDESAPQAETTPTEGAVETTAQPAQTAEQKAVEMFELGEHKFPVTTEFKFTHDGQIVKVPYQKLANTYRNVAHLQNKWATEYKPKIDEFEKVRPEFDRYKGFYDKYGALQEWSEKNPDKWATLESIWQNKDKHLLEASINPQQGGFQNAQLGAPAASNMKPLVDEISALKQQLSGLNSFKETFDQKQQREREEADTQYVLNEKETFQKDYPEINLEETDPDGVKLWAKIMQFGIQNKLPDFESAALKMLKPRLIDTWSSRARNEAVNGLKKDKQQGIIKRSATPITGQGQPAAVNPKNMSYAEIAEMFKNGQFAGQA